LGFQRQNTQYIEKQRQAHVTRILSHDSATPRVGGYFVFCAKRQGSDRASPRAANAGLSLADEGAIFRRH
jgi:hypothetical protein